MDLPEPQPPRSLLSLVQARGYEEKEARALIMDGRVRVDGLEERRPGVKKFPGSHLEIRPFDEYPSRAAWKLRGAGLDLFYPPGDPEFASIGVEDPRSVQALGIRVEGRIAVDLGSSHGGFTQVLLEAGARRVYALDVGRGLLHNRLRQDARVTVLERRNVRSIALAWFQQSDLLDPGGIFFTCDISFLRLGAVLKALGELRGFCVETLTDFPRIRPLWEGVFLLKPQFEDSAATDGGILRDATRREEIIEETRAFAAGLGWSLRRHAPSRLPGGKGNQEECLWLVYEDGPNRSKL